MSATRLQVGWVGGDNLWRVGFYLNALPLVQHLSGLVDILETIWEPQEQVLVFIVRSKDVTGKLFRVRGGLAANPIFRYRSPDQGLLAEARSSVVAQEVH